MSKFQLQFVGILSNVDKSILGIKLSDGFQIEEMATEEAIEALRIWGNFSDNQLTRELVRHACFCDQYIYCVVKGVDITSENGLEPSREDLSTKYYKLINEAQRDLHDTFRLMRLYNGGNICMPLKYLFVTDDGELYATKGHIESLYPIQSEKFSLESSEIPKLTQFISETKIPFTPDFVQNAFETFEQSYQTSNKVLSYLSLMMSLELLLNRNENEVAYSIQRYASVLLGKDIDDAKRIFNDIKKLYTLRSNLIHGSKGKIQFSAGNEEDLMRIRHYVRDLIIEINRLYQTKEDLNLLDRNEFLKRLDFIGVGGLD